MRAAGIPGKTVRALPLFFVLFLPNGVWAESFRVLFEESAESGCASILIPVLEKIPPIEDIQFSMLLHRVKVKRHAGDPVIIRIPWSQWRISVEKLAELARQVGYPVELVPEPTGGRPRQAVITLDTDEKTLTELLRLAREEQFMVEILR